MQLSWVITAPGKCNSKHNLNFFNHKMHFKGICSLAHEHIHRMKYPWYFCYTHKEHNKKFVLKLFVPVTDNELQLTRN